MIQLAWTQHGKDTSWSELRAMVQAGDVAEVVFEGHLVRARLRAEGEVQTMVHVVRVDADEGFVALLEQHAVPYRAVQPHPCTDGSTAGWLVFPLLLVGSFFFFASRQQGPPTGMAAFGRSTANMTPEQGAGITFEDVAGIDEAAEELQEVIAFLRTPEKFTSLGGRPPKGVLLVGPPGTGKTLLARAVAGEADVPFFTISGSAFVEMFVGVGAARVRDLFKTAADHAPCIIFIDELDAVGKTRGGSSHGSNDEREQTLNQLLVELDGFDNRAGIIVMAATNRPEVLDAALLRAGRFDRQVVVDRPDVRGREAILRVHAAQLKTADDVDLASIARQTPGFAGADLANALNEAALLAARHERPCITNDDIEESLERAVAGLEKKNRRLSEHEKRTVAYHECGHAICAAASPGADPVKKISIIPRGIAALGYTVQLPLEDRYLMSKAELLNRITVLYGGRAAEEVVFGDVTTGAHDDIRKASELARRMVTEYGMSSEVGAVDYSAEGTVPSFDGNASLPRARSTSPQTAQRIENEVRGILQGCHARARTMILDNRSLLEEMSHRLLEDEVLDGELMRAFLERVAMADEIRDPPTNEATSCT